MVDTDTVAPFRNLTFFDQEDVLNNRPIEVSITMNDGDNGVFVLPTAEEFPDIGELIITHDPENGTLKVQGLQDKVTAFINLVVFNPANDLDQANSPVPMDFQVKVTDFQGEPVQAELSLALIDKAILTLMPEREGQLLEAFWRQRTLQVETGASLTLALDRINHPS